MRSSLLLFSLWLVLSTALAVLPLHAEPRVVKVGGYVFPPFAERSVDGKWSGLSLDLIELLNASQEDYRFTFLPTSATRRYHDFDNGRFDLVFFESPHWGWQQHAVVSLRGPAVGGEVFVAAALPGRGQDYFASRRDKRVAVFSGYHYAFAGYNPDNAYLRETHNAIITFSQASSLQMVMRDRVDLAVIPQAFLARYLNEHPEYRSQLLIADEPDQFYRHILVKRQSSEPRLNYLSALFDRLEEEGKMQKLLATYGLPASIER